MRKVWLVARREFTATVLTKGFLIGVLLMPTFLGLVMTALPRLIQPPKVDGSIAVIDRTGVVAPQVARRLGDEARLSEAASRKGSGRIAGSSRIHVELLPKDADVGVETAPLRESAEDGRLAVIVISDDVVRKGDPFELYVTRKLDVILEALIAEEVGQAIVDGRITARGYEAEQIRELLERPKANSHTLTPTGETNTNEVARMLVPGAFMILLWIATITSGQTLLATIVEEKSLRVMEVLLSAVSAVELLVGKILGHGAVGLCVLATYMGFGIVSLAVFDALDLVDWSNLALLGFYFVVAFLLIASAMAAIGSAVDDMRGAQALLTPVMLVIALPTVLWLPITRNPNAPLATVLTFVPPISPFVTVLRLAGRDPVPTWQLVGSMVVGVASVAGAVWATTKIFRIGVLMYGKPATIRTLLTWLTYDWRQARAARAARVAAVAAPAAHLGTSGDER